MAIPAVYPDWAVQDTTLPATGNINKVRPKETLRNIGWDMGQIPTAEEFNYQFNLMGQWIRYLGTEFIPTIPNTYLPRNGTRLTLSGDATGTVQWTGPIAATLSVTVVDNSHNHVSANITDATPSRVANMIVRRGPGGEAAFGDIYCQATATNDSATFRLQDMNGRIVGDMSSGPDANSALSISKVNPDTGATGGKISIGTGISIITPTGSVVMSNPRTNNAQEAVANALVRYDYLTAQIANLQSQISAINIKFPTASRASQGWWKDNTTGVILQWTNGAYVNNEQNLQQLNFPIPFPTACLSVQVSAQYTQNTASDMYFQVLNVTRTFVQTLSNGSSFGGSGRPLVFAIGY